MPSRLPSIARTQLVDRLVDAVSRCRLVLVRAPAGYGKTALMMQAFDRLRAAKWRTVWVSLLGPARGGEGVLRPIAEVLGLDWRLAADVADLERMIQDGMAQGSLPVTLFIDGFDGVADAAAEQALINLLLRLPAAACVVLASRRRHALPLSRLRMAQEIVEFDVDDLVFAKDDTLLLLHDVFGPDQAAIAHDRSEGWVGGLVLLAAARARLAGAANDRVFDHHGWRLLDDFFRHEVLGPASPSLQDMLLCTAPLERFTAELANELTQTRHCAALIHQTDAAGLFIVADEPGQPWFRYHALFTAFLRRELDGMESGQAGALLRQAAQWHARAGNDVDAMRCTLAAGDAAAAAALLEQRSFNLIAAGQIGSLLDLLAQVPRGTIEASDEMSLARAWSLTTRWRFAEATALVNRVRNRLARQKPRTAAGRQRHRDRRILLQYQEVMLSLFRDDLSGLEGPCRALLEGPEELPPFIGGSLSSCLVLALREQFKLTDIWRLDVLARKDFERCPDSRHGLIWRACISGPTRFAFGDATAATETLQEAVRLADEMRAEPALGAMPAMLLASVCYARNEIDAAMHLMDRYFASIGKSGLVDSLVAGFVTATQLARLRNDEALRKRIHFMSVELAFVHGFRRLHVALLGDHVRALLNQGATRDAARLVRGLNLSTNQADVMPRPGVTTRDEGIAEIWVRLESEHRRLADALEVATAWRNFTTNARAARSAMRWEILLAQVYLRTSEERQAARALRRAAGLAAPGGLVRDFLDAPAVIHTAMVAQFGPGPSDASPASRLGRQVVALLQGCGEGRSAPREDPVGLATPLTRQEHQVLILTADGLKNVEIARRLGTTEGTIKAYLQRVFEKLDARGRTLAVARARSLRLIT